MFFSGFPIQLRIVILCDIRLSIGVDVTELTPEPNVDPIVLARVMPLSMVLDTLTKPRLYRIRDFLTPRLRIVDPHLPRHISNSFLLGRPVRFSGAALLRLALSVV